MWLVGGCVGGLVDGWGAIGGWVRGWLVGVDGWNC